MNDFSNKITYTKRDGLVINHDYVNFLHEQNFDSFDAIWNNSIGETIKDIKPRSVIKISLPPTTQGVNLYVKKHKMQCIGLRGALKRLLGRKWVSQGLLEFNNICQFRKKGLQTVIPVAAGERYKGFFWVESFLVTKDFSPWKSLEYMIEREPELLSESEGKEIKNEIIKEVARSAKKMHASGLNHRDFNSTHILLYYDYKSSYLQVAFYDLQRVEKCWITRFRWKTKSLARLNYSLPGDLFSITDRKNLLMYYRNKNNINPIDNLLWFFIRRKILKIKRHTEKSKHCGKKMQYFLYIFL